MVYQLATNFQSNYETVAFGRGAVVVVDFTFHLLSPVTVSNCILYAFSRNFFWKIPKVLPRSPKLTFTKATHRANQL